MFQWRHDEDSIGRLSDRCGAQLRSEGVEVAPGQRVLGLLDTALPVSSNLNDLIPPIRIVLWSTDESRPRFCARIERVNKRLAVFVAGAPEELTEASEVEGLCLVWDESDKAITLNPNAPRHSDVS